MYMQYYILHGGGTFNFRIKRFRYNYNHRIRLSELALAEWTRARESSRDG